MTKPRRPTGEHKRYSTGDPYLDLLGAVIRKAISDAKRDLAAAARVWSVAPSIAQRKNVQNPEVSPQDARDLTKKAKRYKHTTKGAIVESRASCGPENKHSHKRG